MRSWRFVTQMLAALGLTMGAAHALELWPNLPYERDRWEYGHLAAFLAWLIGFALLRRSVVVETR